MSYSCPTGCGYEGGLTAMMNHLRLKQDEEHTEMYQRFKQKVDNSDDNEDTEEQEDQEDRPKLEDSFEEEMSEGSEDDGENMEVQQLDSGVEEDEDVETDYRPIGEVEFSRLIDNGIAGSKEECKSLLLKAKSEGYSKIDPETGECKK
jgi:hypothetical protein